MKGTWWNAEDTQFKWLWLNKANECCWLLAHLSIFYNHLLVCFNATAYRMLPYNIASYVLRVLHWFIHVLHCSYCKFFVIWVFFVTQCVLGADQAWFLGVRLLDSRNSTEIIMPRNTTKKLFIYFSIVFLRSWYYNFFSTVMPNMLLKNSINKVKKQQT